MLLLLLGIKILLKVSLLGVGSRFLMSRRTPLQSKAKTPRQKQEKIKHDVHIKTLSEIKRFGMYKKAVP